MKTKLILILAITFFMLPSMTFCQSDIERALKAGEVLLTSFSIIKSSGNSKKSGSKTISSVCIKNRLHEKITFTIKGKDDQDNLVIKKMVVQNDGKECVFNIPKGVYSLEILLSNKEVFKKGEYDFDEDVVISVKKD
ncbi:MAG: hypothetical protein H7174_05240 [Flavobacterium sp.]|nr:hypothetical protein [Flavobacterium sp.]